MSCLPKTALLSSLVLPSAIATADWVHDGTSDNVLTARQVVELSLCGHLVTGLTAGSRAAGAFLVVMPSVFTCLHAIPRTVNDRFITASAY